MGWKGEGGELGRGNIRGILTKSSQNPENGTRLIDDRRGIDTKTPEQTHPERAQRHVAATS